MKGEIEVLTVSPCALLSTHLFSLSFSSPLHVLLSAFLHVPLFFSLITPLSLPSPTFERQKKTFPASVVNMKGCVSILGIE